MRYELRVFGGEDGRYVKHTKSTNSPRGLIEEAKKHLDAPNMTILDTSKDEGQCVFYLRHDKSREENIDALNAIRRAYRSEKTAEKRRLHDHLNTSATVALQDHDHNWEESHHLTLDSAYRKIASCEIVDYRIIRIISHRTPMRSTKAGRVVSKIEFEYDINANIRKMQKERRRAKSNSTTDS